MRRGVAMIDLSAFSQFDVRGPGALAYVQHLTVAQMDRPVGRVIYTPVLGPAQLWSSGVDRNRLMGRKKAARKLITLQHRFQRPVRTDRRDSVTPTNFWSYSND